MSRRFAGVVLSIAAALASAAMAPQDTARHEVRGMVLKIAPSHRSFIVSHDSVAGLMGAMMMSFEVREPRELDGIAPGATVTFTLAVGKDGAVAEHVRAQSYQPSEQDPLTAQRLALLRRMTADARAAETPVAPGGAVPDFTLIDQDSHPVTLSTFRGKVVAVNFIYTSCALPQFCFRIANNFGVLERRFAASLGRDLMLLTITFDPARDTPERLAEYARQWPAAPGTWRFLTGAVADVKRVCDRFGVDFFPDEGLMNHVSHTALIDRGGRLVANIEGNQYSARQLGDLVETVLAAR